MYYIEKPENAFTMLDGKKQKHRDHREASVARSVLISATERLSKPQGGEFSRMADNRCTDRVGNAVGHGFWLFADSILLRYSAFQLLTPARKPPTTSYLTVTLHFTFFFPDLTVITAFPFFLAVMRPFEFTKTTLELLDL